jgi:hypothetical protein
MILISKTYQVFTPESLEDGEPEDSGFMFEDEPHTFRELLRVIQRDGFTNPSSSPATGEPYEWLTTDPEPYYQTGEETIYSLHFSHNNESRAAKYWKAAFKAANIIKGN